MYVDDNMHSGHDKDHVDTSNHLWKFEHLINSSQSTTQPQENSLVVSTFL